MKHLLLSLLLLAPLHAAGPVRCAFDAKVVDWNRRCQTNNYAFSSPLFYTYTISMLAQSCWMGDVRALGLYPGTVLRANLFVGHSYGGTYGCGNDTSSIANIGAPQIPLINDAGDAMDSSFAFQGKWFYQETGPGGGLGAAPGVTVGFNTGLVPNVSIPSANSTHMAWYGTQAAVGDASYIMGNANDGSGSLMLMSVAWPASGFASYLWVAGGAPIQANTNASGFFLGSRTSSAATGVSQYRNGVAAGTSTSVGGGLTTIPMFVFCFNNVSFSAAAPTTNYSGGYSIGSGIATNLQLGYYNAWQRAETLLSRQK